MQPTPPIRAILFDIDGTLIDTVDLIVQSLGYTFKKHTGIDLNRSELRRLIGLPIAIQMHYLDDKITQPVDYEAMEKDDIGFYETHKQLERVIPEAVEAVRITFSKGIKTGLVTSKNKAELENTMPRLQIDPYVGIVVSAEDSARPKPAPDPVLTAVSHLQVSPEETLFIGDTVFDLTCGRSAGSRVAAVAWGAHLPEDLRAMQPDYFFETPADLLEWIQNLPEADHYGSKEENSFQPANRAGHP